MKSVEIGYRRDGKRIHGENTQCSSGQRDGRKDPQAPEAPPNTALCVCVWTEECKDVMPGAAAGILQPWWTLQKTAMPTWDPAIANPLNAHWPPPPSRQLVEKNKPSKFKSRLVKYSYLQQHSEVIDSFFPGMF